MVSIKKKSRRQPARLRYGIEKKVSAFRKKQKKEAKKRPKKKRKTEEYPMIPNSFPYKGKILAEIEEKSKFKGKNSQKKESMEEIMFPHVNTMVEDSVTGENEFSGVEEDDTCEIDEEIGSWYGFSEDESDNQRMGCIKREKSLKAFSKTFKEVIEASDVVLYILDARDPQGTRSQQVEDLVLQNHEKKLIFILNKIDLIPYDNLMEWLAYLRTSFTCLPFRAVSSFSSHSFNNTVLKPQSLAFDLIKFLKSYAHKQNLKRSLFVGVVGYPNVGKSSIVNFLVSCLNSGNTKKPCITGSEAGITTSIKQVKLDDKIKLIDSPGIVYPLKSDEQKKTYNTKAKDQARLILINAIPPSNITDPIYCVSQILCKLHSNSNLYEKLEKFYQLPPIVSINNDITTDFLVHVAKKRGRLKKGGIPDLESAAKAVINDWCSGKIQWWTNAPTKKKNNITTNNGSSSIIEDDPILVTEWAKEFDLDTKETPMEINNE
ncbi:hypothetical protein T552_02494 [Pneumocystis carinii B80]|uniref:CP-type G domain-containing protein n=1 Tax=Pneumocystis carinii (strain B80) TaxID=1408658 RepID=A0A0W4ZFB4_PNEC8|nr:hypothetical protein T552_02494 [Pneumocystis carinii B80]KTW27002.1 hypothetical protein T552_02494 [Pneumocystis carinii B80]